MVAMDVHSQENKKQNRSENVAPAPRLQATGVSQRTRGGSPSSPILVDTSPSYQAGVGQSLERLVAAGSSAWTLHRSDQSTPCQFGCGRT